MGGVDASDRRIVLLGGAGLQALGAAAWWVDDNKQGGGRFHEEVHPCDIRKERGQVYKVGCMGENVSIRETSGDTRAGIQGGRTREKCFHP